MTNYTEEEAFNIVTKHLDQIRDDFFSSSMINCNVKFQLNSLNTISILLGLPYANDNKLRHEVRTNWEYYQSIGCYKEQSGYKQYVLSYRAILHLFELFGYKLEKGNDVMTTKVKNVQVNYDNLFTKLIEDRRITLTNKKQELEHKLGKVNAALMTLDELVNIDEVLISI